MICGRRSVALLAGLLLALVVLVPASAQVHAGAKYGGTLVVGLTGSESTLDPTLATGFLAIEVDRSICEKLYEFDAKQQIVPGLAVGLPAISKDKRTYTIRVRQGVEFNDGTPFNAQAVVTSLQRMLTLPESIRVSDLGPIDSVTAAGPDTVVIKLQSPFTPLLGALASPAGIAMSPTQLDRLGTSFGTNPVCVGPFMFDNRVVGDHVTVIKSPYYYNRGAVHLDKIVYKPMSDAVAAAAALRAGDIHVLDAISPTEVPAIQQTSGLLVLRQRSVGWTGIQINIGNKNGIGKLPYTNVGTPLASSAKLRQAFEEALDRDTIVRIANSGAAVPGCTPVSPASPAFDPTVKCTPYNPGHARKLVTASGIPNPTVHLLATGASTLLAQVIQAMEAAVGINVVIDQVDGATLNARRLAGSFDTSLYGWTGSPSTDRNIYAFVATDGSLNAVGYSNPRLDLILANSHKATSIAALKTLYHAAEQILVDDRPLIFLSHGIRYQGVNTSVTGVSFDANSTPVVAFAQYR